MYKTLVYLSWAVSVAIALGAGFIPYTRRYGEISLWNPLVRFLAAIATFQAANTIMFFVGVFLSLPIQSLF